MKPGHIVRPVKPRRRPTLDEPQHHAKQRQEGDLHHYLPDPGRGGGAFNLVWSGCCHATQHVPAHPHAASRKSRNGRTFRSATTNCSACASGSPVAWGLHGDCIGVLGYSRSMAGVLRLLSSVTPEPSGTSYAPGALVFMRRFVVAGSRNMTKTMPILALLLLVSLPGLAAPTLALNPYDSKVDLIPRNAIDNLVFAKLEACNVQSATVCSDGVFVRRAYLDIIGTLPSGY